MTVSDEIIKVLNALCEKFGIAIDWTNKNVIPYLQELCDKCVSYELWTTVFSVIIGILLIIGFVFLICKTLKKNKNGDNLWEIAYRKDLEIPLAIGLGVYGVISIFIFFDIFTGLTQIITCLTFPEKVILEFIKEIKL